MKLSTSFPATSPALIGLSLRPGAERGVALRAWLLLLTVVVALLFAQQFSLLHALSHAEQEVAEKGSPAPHAHCLQCDALLAAEAAPPASPLPLALAGGLASVPICGGAVACIAASQAFYHSRAPPSGA